MQINAPVRVERTYVQKIHARPEEVFPLLCPVREAEWVAGWDPLLVLSKSGVIEPNCVFVTNGDGDEAVWVVTRHDPTNLKLEMLKLTPGVTVGRISITLRPNEEGETDVWVSYMYTALSKDGETFIEGYTEQFFTQFMQVWEATLNDYLEGRKS